MLVRCGGAPELLLRPSCGFEATLETRGVRGVSLSIICWLNEVGLGLDIDVVFGVDAGSSSSVMSCWGMGEPGTVSGVVTVAFVPTLLGVLNVFASLPSLSMEVCLFFFRLNNLMPILRLM